MQIIEGLLYYKLGEVNFCGTQAKLSAILTGVISMFLAEGFIKSKKENNSKLLFSIGNNSFGIFFAHLAVMSVLEKIPKFSLIIFPINGVITIIVTYVMCIIGKKILRSYSKYLAL